MAKPGPYSQVTEGEWLDVSRRGEREQCCHCGLVHRVDYRIVEKNGRNQMQYRCWTDDKATARIRKRAGIRIVSD